jgi:hypothetical protein
LEEVKTASAGSVEVLSLDWEGDSIKIHGGHQWHEMIKSRTKIGLSSIFSQIWHNQSKLVKFLYISTDKYFQ